MQTLALSLTLNPTVLTRCSTISKCPFMAALWSAVSFASVRSNMWYPILEARYRATSTWPPTADRWKALNPPYIDGHTTQAKYDIGRHQSSEIGFERGRERKYSLQHSYICIHMYQLVKLRIYIDRHIAYTACMHKQVQEVQCILYLSRSNLLTEGRELLSKQSSFPQKFPSNLHRESSFQPV